MKRVTLALFGVGWIAPAIVALVSFSRYLSQTEVVQESANPDYLALTEGFGALAAIWLFVAVGYFGWHWVVGHSHLKKIIGLFQ